MARHKRRYTNPYLLFGLLSLAVAVGLTLILIYLLNFNWLIGWLISINLVTFFLFGYDKLIASGGATRVPEAVLLGSVFLGGFVGGPLGSVLFHHKTLKVGFQLIMWVGVVVSIAWVALYYFVGRG